MAGRTGASKKKFDANDTDFKNRILYKLEDIPQGRNPEWDRIHDKGIPELWIYHRFMKEYGWIPWEEWEGMPLLVRDGLIKCLNIDAEYQEAKLEEAKRKQR